MGNSQSAELTEGEPKPRRKRNRKKRRQEVTDRKDKEQEVRLVEDVEKEGDGEEKKVVIDLPFEHFSFPFENVVFEGGGPRSFAYCGSVRVSVSAI